MSPDRIIAFWGADNLKRWSPATLQDVAIPQSSKQFLVGVGLPFKEDWTLRFDSEADQLPRLPGKPHYRRIGFDDFVPICLDERRHGAVITAEVENSPPESFVNASVEQFGEFLLLYQQYRLKARTASEEEILLFIPTIEERMRKADADAFSDPNNYWPEIIEQMSAGLL
ncbi:MAG TPA: SUKH-4 family immunity protein [Planctomycetaceae bacterium]|jgi:hypothetical protein|nr:SUKH-4 family immunity protein [Planctomycetaceae bacterium]